MSVEVRVETVRSACVMVMPDGTRVWTEREVTTTDDWREIRVEGQAPWRFNFGHIAFGPERTRSSNEPRRAAA